MQPKNLSQILMLVGLWILMMPAHHAKAQMKQEDAILEVMKAKTEAYFDANLNGWQSFWLQDSSSSRSVISKFGFSNQVGWQGLLPKLAEDSQRDGPYKGTVSFEDVHIRLSGNMAFTEANEHVRWEGGELSPYDYTHTYTLLLREDNVWKIANQVRVATATFSKTPLNRENELNTIGYELLNEKRIDEAIKIFIVNVQLNPASWNAYDSLGEAYALSENTKLAIANYEKSLELNPKNESGKEHLARLKKQ